MSVHMVRIAGIVLGGLLVLVLGVRFALGIMFSSGCAPADALEIVFRRISYQDSRARSRC